METLKTIEILKSEVKAAKTYDSNGRQLVVDSCRKLYNLIEEGLYGKYGQNAVNDAYNDLCNGNFAEPFYCEKKKGKFELYAKIYVENVA